MQIHQIEEKYFDEIAKVDQMIFEHKNRRTLENLKLMIQYNEDWCFCAIEDGRIVGYIFSKNLWKEWYFGPIGVLPEYQNRWIASKLIDKSLEYLKKDCNTIWLEMMPEKWNILNLYYKKWFEVCFPSIIFDFPPNYSELPCGENVFLVEKYDENLIKEIRELTKETWIDFSGDLKKIMENKWKLVIYIEKWILKWFFAQKTEISARVWWFVNKSENRNEITKELLVKLSKYLDEEAQSIRINWRNKEFINFLFSENFKIKRSVNRMVLKWYSWDYFNTSDDYVARAWRG